MTPMLIEYKQASPERLREELAEGRYHVEESLVAEAILMRLLHADPVLAATRD